MARTVLAATLLALSALPIGGCGSPPQIGSDKATFKAVDALYTAVGLREPKLVDQCCETLKGLREAGKLPHDASAALDSIITEARGQKWEPAQTHLSQFMLGQHR